jgi:hypothetical protein
VEEAGFELSVPHDANWASRGAQYAYGGQYFPPVAYRKDRLKGVIGLAEPVYWNMEKFVG